MKLFSIALLSLLIYHCCTGYPVEESNLSQDLLLENGTSFESRFDTSNETTSNASSPLDMHGFFKNLKEGIKTVKDKVGDTYDKFKEKVKDFKNKIGSKGGSGGGYYRDDYDEDDDKDLYDRDYYRRDSNYSGTGNYNPTNGWIAVGICSFIAVVGFVVVIVLKIREIRQR